MIHYLSLVGKCCALRNPWESGMQDISFARSLQERFSVGPSPIETFPSLTDGGFRGNDHEFALEDESRLLIFFYNSYKYKYKELREHSRERTVSKRLSSRGNDPKGLCETNPVKGWERPRIHGSWVFYREPVPGSRSPIGSLSL